MRQNVLINGLYQQGKYPAPSNLNYFWNFGVFALVSLLSQIITGILLVMYYTPHVDYAFLSIEHIMRDIPSGWLLRYLHANGASVFFIVVYAHISRGLIYGSYFGSRALLWCTGVIIFLLMILTAFLGYILPWGQMSLWGATVITNLASIVPVVGEEIVLWLWGGFSVANPTLNKFFSLHYIFPFLILALVGIHLLLLHVYGSNNPIGIGYYQDKINFAPHYISKDSFSLFPYMGLIAILVFFIPNTLGHPDNYIPANGDITPEHIVPEWYFLPFYAILRSIPDKAFGVIALLASIVILLIIPFLHNLKVRNAHFRPIAYYSILLFIASNVILTFIGSSILIDATIFVGQLFSLIYFGTLISLTLNLDECFVKLSRRNYLLLAMTPGVIWLGYVGFCVGTGDFGEMQTLLVKYSPITGSDVSSITNLGYGIRINGQVIPFSSPNLMFLLEVHKNLLPSMLDSSRSFPEGRIGRVESVESVPYHKNPDSFYNDPSGPMEVSIPFSGCESDPRMEEEYRKTMYIAKPSLSGRLGLVLNGITDPIDSPIGSPYKLAVRAELLKTIPVGSATVEVGVYTDIDLHDSRKHRLGLKLNLF